MQVDISTKRTQLSSREFFFWAKIVIFSIANGFQAYVFLQLWDKAVTSFIAIKFSPQMGDKPNKIIGIGNSTSAPHHGQQILIIRCVTIQHLDESQHRNSRTSNKTKKQQKSSTDQIENDLKTGQRRLQVSPPAKHNKTSFQPGSRDCRNFDSFSSLSED
jgi:hypothetical protein